MTIFDQKNRLFTIPPGANFMAALSTGLDQIMSDYSLEAPEITLYLPNQRSIRAFQAHKMKKTSGRPTLLPALKPLGSMEEDEVILSSLAVFEEDLTLPPAISPMARIFYLQKEIEKHGQAFGLSDLSAPQRLMLASELARLLDQMQNAGLPFRALEDLAPEKFAGHWQEILGFLKIVSKTWPETLKKMGLMDPVERHKALVKRLAEVWEKSPSENPVIAAGSTGSVPVTRMLLKAIAGLPKGVVIFPGLDKEMDSESWDAIEETHPQYAMKVTLDELGQNRGKVADWPFLEATEKTVETRLDFFRKALVPAKISSRWHHQKLDQREVMKSFGVEVCPTPRTEAGAIALMMRHALEDKTKTAALITPDRDLAEKVKAELERWNLEVDDSAGEGLLATPPGVFFMLLVEMAGAGFSPSPLLSFLKHPLTTVGHDRGTIMTLARELDIRFLRGVASGGGLSDLKRKIKTAREFKNKKALLELIGSLETLTAELASDIRKNSLSFSHLLARHIEAAKILSRPKEGGLPLIWKEADGEHFAGFLTALEENAKEMGQIEGAEYPGILRNLMEGERVRRTFPAHPRLFIWGALEARLQRPDLVILGGLNEGTWPPEGSPDPWMSREMRKTLGLPTPDFRVGQSAHDFFLALGAPEVVITRASKIEGTPATPSRWLQRAGALLGGRLPGPSKPWLAWFEALDMPGTLLAVKPPAPKPPLTNRPQGLSVTAVEKWMHDPYSIYAKYILGLTPLDDLEALPGAADKGQLLHKILELYFRENNYRLPPQPLQALLKTAEKEFAKPGFARPGVKAFWWPRFVEVAEAFVRAQSERERKTRVLGTEARGEITFKTGKNSFGLKATADRVDQGDDGGLCLIDYKSGVLPSKIEMKRGKKPQLPLEGVIAEEGGFKDLPGGRVSTLEIWDVGSSGVTLKILKIDEGIEDYIENAREGLAALVDHFANPENPYLSVPDPSRHRFGDYDPLSRYREWQNRPLPRPGREGEQ